MATKLPSGRYRTQVFIGYENGKRKYKSFTADTAKKADLAALQWQAEHPSTSVSNDTLSTAMERFIKNKKYVLSPSTVRGYVSLKKNIEAKFPRLCAMKIDLIQSADLQDMINQLVNSGSSSKTCKNYYGFLCSVWKNRQEEIPQVKLPPKVKPEFNIPDASTLSILYRESKGTPLEIPILLASIGPMRRGEIVAATLDDLEGNVMHVRRTAVINENSEQVIKEYTKTYESSRDIILPQSVADRIREQGYVCNLGLLQLSDRFTAFVKKCGLKHCRFHDLRHSFVSICHAAGIPDAYIQQRGGWASNYTMNNVYRHTLSEIQKEENTKINSIFSKLF